MKDHQYFMREAVKEGNKQASPYNFGAVIVLEGEIIGVGHNEVYELNDPSAHDAIMALRQAAQKTGQPNLPGSVMYCSHEPCFMCTAAAAWAKVERIIYATQARENKDFLYHSESLSIEDFAAKLPRKIKVEYIQIEG